MARRRTPRGEGKADILAAAILEFSEKGYAGASTASIARRAGVTQPLVHHHFGSKPKLWRHVADALFQDLQTTLAKAAEETQDAEPIKRLEHLVRAFVRFSGHRPELARLIRAEAAAGGANAAAIHERYVKPLIDFLKSEFSAGQKAALIRSELDPNLFFFLLTGASTQLFGDCFAARKLGVDPRDPETIERNAAFVAHVLLAGILVPKAAARLLNR